MLRRVTVDGVHHPAVLAVLLGSDGQLCLPIGHLGRMRVLGAVVLDAGMHVGVIVTKFLGRWGRGTGSQYVVRYS
jgi:hypothetical protein